ncbi:unnamed protein product [Allacma fusca]|uniref:Type VII secretion system protein EssD-like domain-containing protein n=1 Tax=Allacma fusca TaxID=39272 RepID=A0A8J2LGU9_9HEXA|nr:unnamed protein product [Allacma fusca]
MKISDVLHNCPGNNFHYHTLTAEERRAQQTSVTNYAYCSYPGLNDGNGKICNRTEIINAEIRNVVNRNGRNFGPAHTTYMNNCLQPMGGDERGHLIAATLGGTNQLYNLIPQHRAVNANRGVAGDPQNYWFNNERAVNNFLRAGRDNRIDLEVRLQYAGPNDRRPDRINVRVRAFRGNERVRTWNGVQWDEYFQIPNRGRRA